MSSLSKLRFNICNFLTISTLKTISDGSISDLQKLKFVMFFVVYWSKQLDEINMFPNWQIIRLFQKLVLLSLKVYSNAGYLYSSTGIHWCSCTFLCTNLIIPDILFNFNVYYRATGKLWIHTVVLFLKNDILNDFKLKRIPIASIISGMSSFLFWTTRSE